MILSGNAFTQCLRQLLLYLTRSNFHNVHKFNNGGALIINLCCFVIYMKYNRLFKTYGTIRW